MNHMTRCIAVLAVNMGPFLIVGTNAAKPKTKGYNWPEVGMGSRTSERVSAGKRAAKYIACEVCEERVFAHFPKKPEEDKVNELFDDGGLADLFGDVKEFCGMRKLAQIFRGERLEVKPKSDGSAVVQRAADGSIPFYEEINTSELAFHWLSLAIQHACTETFRRDADTIVKDLEKAFRSSAGLDGMGRDLPMRLRFAARKGCSRSKMCKAAVKLKPKTEL
eukprot:TRINITY_DN55643_c0_g1_i1.p1 TRINITY_DN55643_c0_g1~~TRINITY_DN55643_c0_g1_i1.p1  ORF type:complete len:221 (+),score=42.85 TRINITY_DN55643_c0_g1_i1:109-771(+)